MNDPVRKLYSHFFTIFPNFSEFHTLGDVLKTDWYGDAAEPEARYLLGLTESHFCFLAGREAPARSHPDGNAGEYHAELWKYDVAELFIKGAGENSYLEFNLSPHGAWWSCEFESPRKPAVGQPLPLQGVTTESQCTPEGWRAMAVIPRASLPDLEKARLNVSFILNSPEQIFLTAAAPAPGEPNFHRPKAFLPLEIKDA